MVGASIDVAINIICTVRKPRKLYLVEILICHECEPELGRTSNYARRSTLEQGFETLFTI